ncbi:MAG TPA: MFS transporter [Pseudonocardiaceae bacterium]|nr:MFS transporter [Pseudonocardiaceae bacterium]
MGDSEAPRRRWVVLFVCWAAFTMTSVDRSAWGPAAVAVSDSLGVSLAALGVFATGYYLGYVLSNAGGGVLIDWLGGRAVLTCGGFGAGLFMVLFGSASSIPAGIALQGAVGLFAGVDFAAGIKLITSWFARGLQGFAFGVFMTATSLGTVIANAVVPSLIRVSGWQVSYRVFGGMTLLVALLCPLLIRDGPSAEPSGRRLPGLRVVLRNRDLALLGLAGFGGLWGTYGFITWSNALMTKGAGIDPVAAGVVLVIFAGIAVGVKPVVGWVCDRLGLGLRIPIVATLVFFGATLVVFGSLRSYTQFLWVAPLLGIGAYAYSPLTAAMTPILTGHRVAGSAAGAINAFWQLGSVTVPAVIGPVFVATGSFLITFAALAAGPLIGAVAMLLVRERSR